MKRGMRTAHPGALIKETIEGLKEETGHNYSQGKIAKGLGVTRKMLSNILNEHEGVSSEMCVRLSEAFGTSAEFWLNVQRNYDYGTLNEQLSVKLYSIFGRFQIGRLCNHHNL